MIHFLGKFLELVGMVILGWGLVGGLVQDDVKGEMAMLGIGAAIFLTGYFLEHKIAYRK